MKFIELKKFSAEFSNALISLEADIWKGKSHDDIHPINKYKMLLVFHQKRNPRNLTRHNYSWYFLPALLGINWKIFFIQFCFENQAALSSFNNKRFFKHCRRNLTSMMQYPQYLHDQKMFLSRILCKSVTFKLYDDTSNFSQKILKFQ